MGEGVLGIELGASRLQDRYATTEGRNRSYVLFCHRFLIIREWNRPRQESPHTLNFFRLAYHTPRFLVLLFLQPQLPRTYPQNPVFHMRKQKLKKENQAGFEPESPSQAQLPLWPQSTGLVP